MQPARRFGDYDVTILCDGVFETSVDSLVHQAGPAALKKAIEAWGKPAIQMDVNCFLLCGPAGTILVDAGCGTSWGPDFGKARQMLADLGVTPDKVDHVLMTHDHGDHAYGLFDGEQPYFPRAQVHSSRPELDFFTDQKMRETVLPTRQGGFDVTATMQALYGPRLKAFDYGPVLPGIESVPLPGHTPGHSGFLLKGGKESLMIWGDMLHMGGVQPGDPELGMIYDIRPAIAVQTRRAAVAEAAQNGWIVAASHITGFGRLEQSANGYTIVSA